jgi:hypothetical protein
MRHHFQTTKQQRESTASRDEHPRVDGRTMAHHFLAILAHFFFCFAHGPPITPERAPNRAGRAVRRRRFDSTANPRPPSPRHARCMLAPREAAVRRPQRSRRGSRPREWGSASREPPPPSPRHAHCMLEPLEAAVLAGNGRAAASLPASLPRRRLWCRAAADTAPQPVAQRVRFSRGAAQLSAAVNP